MASRYWVGGTASWNGTAGSKWALTSGGAGGQAEPTSADDVFLDANSGANVVTIDTTTAICKSLTCTGYTGTLAGSTAMDVYGSVTAVAGMTWSHTGTVTAKLTAGTATITSAGKTMGPLTMNGAGGTVTFADAFVTTGTCTLTAGTWNDGNVNLTMSAFSAAGTATRVITYGTTNTWSITGSGTVWDFGGANITENALTRVLPNIATVDFNYSGGSARTIKAGTSAVGRLPKLKISAGSGTVTMAPQSVNDYPPDCRGIDCTGFSGVLDHTANATTNYGGIYRGSIVYPGTMTVTNTGGAAKFYCIPYNSGESVILSSSVSLPFTTIVIGSALGTGTITLGANLTGTGTLDLGTAYGTASMVFDAAGYSISVAAVECSNAFTRTITMGSGTWTLTSTAATTVWNMATTTGLTLNANTATIDLTGVTANTRTLTSNSVLMPKLKISAGSGAVTCTNGNYNGIEMTSGYSGTFANQTISFYGNVLLGANATYTAGANAWTYTGTSGTATFNSGGVTVDWPITVNGIGGTLAQAANLAMGATRTLTLTRGTFNSAGYTNNVTAVLMNGTAGTTTLGSAGTSWACNLTCNGASGTLTFADAFVTTGTCTLTAGTWNDGNVNLTMSAFSVTGAGVKVLTYGTSNTWFVTGSGTVWDLGTAGANFTSNTLTATLPNLTTVKFNYSGASSRTIKQDAGSNAYALPIVAISAGNGTVTMAPQTINDYPPQLRGLDCTGFSGTLDFSANSVTGQALVVRGSIAIPAGVTITSSGGANTAFVIIQASGDTSATTIDTNSVNFPFTTIKFWGAVAGSTKTLLSNFVTTGNIQCGEGAALTFDANGYAITCGTFSSSTTNTRTITMGSGTWTLTSTAATTVWNMATTTGLTLNANTATIDLTGVTTSVRTITANSALLPTIKISGGTGAGSVTLTNVNCAGLTFANTYACTGFANQTVTIRGPVTLSNHASFALTAGANAWTLASTSGSNAFESNGKACDFPITVNGVGGTHAFSSAFSHGITRTLTLTNGTVDFGSYTHTMGFFASANANVRVIATGTATLNFPTTATVWDTSTSTNLSVTGTGTIALTANSATARTITGGSALLPSLSMATGSFAPTFTNCNFLNMTMTAGWTGTMANQTVTFRGNVSLSSAGTYTAGANAWTYAGTSGTGTWTSNTKTTDWPITVNGAGGTLQLADTFIHGSTRTLTLTAGTFDVNSVACTHGLFVSTGSTTRTWATGSGTLTFPTTDTVIDCTSATNLTVTGTGLIDLTANSATARTIIGSATTSLPSLSMATGSYAPTFTSCNFLNITVTSGYTGTVANQAVTLRGTVSLAATGAVYSAGSNAWTWANTSGTVTWASNGRTLDFPVTITGSATHQLADALTLGTSRALTLTAGTLDLVSYASSVGSYVSTGASTRVLATGSATLALSGTGTVWDTSTATGWSYTGTGTIKLTDSSATARTITAGNVTLPSVWVSAGTSTTTATNVAGVLDLNFTGMGAGTWSCGAGTFTIGGSLTLVSAMTYTCAANLTWNATSTGKTITSWGKSWTSGTVTFSGSGGGWTLQDAPATFTSANALTVAVGSLDTNGKAVTTPALVFSGSGVRTLTLGASTVTLTGTATVFDASGSNQTVNAGTSTVDITDTSTTQKLVYRGGKTFNIVKGKKTGGNRINFADAGKMNWQFAA